MFSQADRFRRRAIDAQYRAAHAGDPNLKQGFTEIANGWLALADEATWLERQSTDLLPPAEFADRPAMQEPQQIQPEKKGK
jgi:hypothetical protein